MIKYARRLKRYKAVPQASNIPIGNHLLLGGILVTVNGVVLDIGYPAWMFERLPKEPEKKVRQRLRKRPPLRKQKHLGFHRWGRRGGLSVQKSTQKAVRCWSVPSVQSPIEVVPTTSEKEPQALNDAAQGRKHLCKNGLFRGTPSAASAVDTSGQRLTRVQKTERDVPPLCPNNPGVGLPPQTTLNWPTPYNAPCSQAANFTDTDGG